MLNTPVSKTHIVAADSKTLQALGLKSAPDPVPDIVEDYLAARFTPDSCPSTKAEQAALERLEHCNVLDLPEIPEKRHKKGK